MTDIIEIYHNKLLNYTNNKILLDDNDNTNNKIKTLLDNIRTLLNNNNDNNKTLLDKSNIKTLLDNSYKNYIFYNLNNIKNNIKNNINDDYNKLFNFINKNNNFITLLLEIYYKNIIINTKEYINNCDSAGIFIKLTYENESNHISLHSNHDNCNNKYKTSQNHLVIEHKSPKLNIDIKFIYVNSIIIGIFMSESVHDTNNIKFFKENFKKILFIIFLLYNINNNNNDNYNFNNNDNISDPTEISYIKDITQNNNGFNFRNNNNNNNNFRNKGKPSFSNKNLNKNINKEYNNFLINKFKLYKIIK